MKRLSVNRLAVLAMLAVFGFGALAIATPDAAAVASEMHGVSRTSTDDFSFASMNADYLLGRDAEGHSTLDASETLVAVFPEIDQNRGIRRAIPLKYDGHPTDLHVLSVTDENGAARSFESEVDDDGEFLVITIAADDYVHGAQSYVINYTQKYVTLDPDDSELQEFYRDVNGVGWAQPFDVVTATVRMSPELGASFAHQAACYQGPQGSSQQCADLSVSQETPPTITATARNLAPFENLTLAVAFDAATFVPRDSSLTSSPAGLAGLAAGIASLGALAAALVVRLRRWRNAPGRGIVIAEYEPPTGVDPLLAAELLSKGNKGVTASILNLAVTGAVRIIETKKKRFDVELRDPALVSAEEQAICDALFGAQAHAGARRSLGRADNKLATKLVAITTATRKRALTEGFRSRVDVKLRLLLGTLAVILTVTAVLFSIGAADADIGGGWPFGIMAAAILASLGTLLLVGDVRPFTTRGSIAVEQLKGLELYIRLAEADRLRVLQSPSGALRDDVPARPGNDVPIEQVLRIHEKLLPYSVLFGLEKEWSAELASLYAQAQEPGWYSGRSGFNAAAFAVGVSSFTSASSTSWSSASSSSSSGGSGGGGFSGGGGGGGGGGGV